MVCCVAWTVIGTIDVLNRRARKEENKLWVFISVATVLLQPIVLIGLATDGWEKQVTLLTVIFLLLMAMSFILGVLVQKGVVIIRKAASKGVEATKEIKSRMEAKSKEHGVPVEVSANNSATDREMRKAKEVFDNAMMEESAKEATSALNSFKEQL